MKISGFPEKIPVGKNPHLCGWIDRQGSWNLATYNVQSWRTCWWQICRCANVLPFCWAGIRWDIYPGNGQFLGFHLSNPGWEEKNVEVSKQPTKELYINNKWKLLFWDPRKRWTVNWDDVSLSRRRANAENREKSTLWKVQSKCFRSTLTHLKEVWHHFTSVFHKVVGERLEIAGEFVLIH